MALGGVITFSPNTHTHNVVTFSLSELSQRDVHRKKQKRKWVNAVHTQVWGRERSSPWDGVGIARWSARSNISDRLACSIMKYAWKELYTGAWGEVRLLLRGPAVISVIGSLIHEKTRLITLHWVCITPDTSISRKEGSPLCHCDSTLEAYLVHCVNNACPKQCHQRK